jgi:RNA polymerase sigma-70 factor, ECF subfamily
MPAKTLTLEIESRVIKEFMAGSKGAFQEIYEKTADFVYNVIYKMVRNEQDALDLAHDVYVKIFEKRGDYTFQAAFSSWLYRIAVNHTLNHLKRQKWFFARRSIIYKADEYLDENLNNIEKKDDLRLAQALLNKLKPDYKACLVLRDLEELSYEKIADILKINVGTVKSRISRGRSDLRALYQKEVNKNEN